MPMARNPQAFVGHFGYPRRLPVSGAIHTVISVGGIMSFVTRIVTVLAPPGAAVSAAPPPPDDAQAAAARLTIANSDARSGPVLDMVFLRARGYAYLDR